ncbi:MAG: PadR family transcriptional regulator, partial [Chloroflexota bacterium]
MEAIFKMRHAHRYGPWGEPPVHIRFAKSRYVHHDGPEDFEPPDRHWGGPGGPGEGPERFEIHRKIWVGHHASHRRPGGPWGRGGGPRVGRGDVRAAILLLLAERPLHGYQIIQEISERSGGLWRPSPGSVYPALQLLEDEGLVRAEQEAERRVFHLTDAGQSHVEAHRAELAAARDAVTGSVDDAVLELRDLHEQLGVALMQVARAGTPAQITEARALLTG